MMGLTVIIFVLADKPLCLRTLQKRLDFEPEHLHAAMLELYHEGIIEPIWTLPILWKLKED